MRRQSLESELAGIFASEPTNCWTYPQLISIGISMSGCMLLCTGHVYAAASSSRMCSALGTNGICTTTVTFLIRLVGAFAISLSTTQSRR